MDPGSLQEIRRGMGRYGCLERYCLVGMMLDWGFLIGLTMQQQRNEQFVSKTSYLVVLSAETQTSVEHRVLRCR